MNTRKNLQDEILNFLQDENEKVMLITGTNQYEKHMEVLRVINKNVPDRVKVLFRANGKDNLQNIFENKIGSPKLNTLVRLGRLNLYIDTINRRTWQGGKYNFSIIYPIDSLCRMKDEQREEIMKNLLRKTVNKLFIVSWTDNFDYNWLEQFGIDRKVVFDAEEEDSAYHNRVLESINGLR